ncbi:hypothetical protein HDU67_003030 [Dinochytrium kinnereticum]|nr:hypothetical protein HDU67_003030 [Dinochytrium kinnereticum]
MPESDLPFKYESDTTGSKQPVLLKQNETSDISKQGAGSSMVAAREEEIIQDFTRKLNELESENRILLQGNKLLMDEKNASAFTAAAIIELRNASENSLKKAIEAKNEIQARYDELYKEHIETLDLKSDIQARYDRLLSLHSSERESWQRDMNREEDKLQFLQKALDFFAFDICNISRSDICLSDDPVGIIRRGIAGFEEKFEVERKSLRLSLDMANSAHIQAQKENAALLETMKSYQSERDTWLLSKKQANDEKEKFQRLFVSAKDAELRFASEIKAMSEKVSELEEKIKESYDALESKSEDLLKIQQKAEMAKRDSNDAAHEVKALKMEISRLNAILGETEKAFDSCQNAKKQLEEELLTSRGREELSISKANKVAEDIKCMESAIESLNLEKSSYSLNLEQLNEYVSQLEADLQEERRRNVEHHERILSSSQDSATSSQENALNELHAICLDLKFELEKSGEKLLAVKKERIALSKCISSLQSSIQLDKMKITALETDLNTKNLQISDMVYFSQRAEEKHSLSLKDKENQIIKLTGAIHEANLRLSEHQNRLELKRRKEGEVVNSETDPLQVEKNMNERLAELQKELIQEKESCKKLREALDQKDLSLRKFRENGNQNHMSLQRALEERDDARHQQQILAQERDEAYRRCQHSALELSQLSEFSNGAIVDNINRLKELSTSLEHALLESRQLRERINILENESISCKGLLSKAQEKILELESDNKNLSDHCMGLETIIADSTAQLTPLLKIFEAVTDLEIKGRDLSDVLKAVMEFQAVRYKKLETTCAETAENLQKKSCEIELLSGKCDALQSLLDHNVERMSDLERRLHLGIVQILGKPLIRKNNSAAVRIREKYGYIFYGKGDSGIKQQQSNCKLFNTLIFNSNF